ncbi:MAG: beta-lactamase family protein [Planctomycetes bacterium]|nr:beta-lactamase family protein [Planctomycetota bacterium]MCB9918018.1 beta-lactamase family protein [Planctomycetota bacterium]
MTNVRTLLFSAFVAMAFVAMATLGCTHTTLTRDASHEPSLQATSSLRNEDAIVRRIETAMGRQQIPGLQVAIGIDGQIAFERGFGFADVENEVRTTAETRFRTASIAKSMTAVATLQSVERGRVDLDADVRTHVPEFPEKRWPVTVRDLLGHLGGVRHYVRPGESTGTKHYDSVRASLACFANDPLVVKPRERFVYTTFGYTLLGCVVEAATEQSFEDALRASIWRPAGMTHTCIDDETRLVPGRARGYEIVNGEVVPAALHDTSMKVPGGGLRSTATDLVRFGFALLQDDLVQRSTRDLMWTRQTTADGKATGYGLGFSIGAFDDEPLIGHSGGQAGTSCLLRMRPNHGHVVAVMTNREGARLDALVRDVLRLLASG